MRQIWQKLKVLGRGKLAFSAAMAYLLCLLVLISILPWLPLPYAPNYLDLSHTLQPPFSANAAGAEEGFHLLGTDALGRDVLSNMLYGARTAFFVSLPVMLLSTLLGLLVGMSAGYFAGKGVSLNRGKFLVLCLSFLLFAFYAVYLPAKAWRLGLGDDVIFYSLGTFLLFTVLLYTLFFSLFRRIRTLKKKVVFPVDELVLKVIEVLSSIPRFVLILLLAALFPPSVVLLSAILVFTLWTETARLARAEMLRTRQLSYFEAAHSLGLTNWQLLYRQALPNIVGPILVSFTFGLGSLLTLESTLSFLNIGVPTTFVSWGRLIAGIKTNTSAWWLVLFPGAMLTATVLALYTTSYYLTSAFTQHKD
ncbi:peptide/nickel transport system permease protein [Pontibacter ummariensis]|uniref:Peptide/nickel transport system permease protein n=1 Tax=Pontibacter ummariensis TaxID=1610492 RepID=A0A239JVS4_9BACT|nr:ABC transporter permease [Pontibacter ummariensis]PRY07308.1 peptide/nickel transport system permease protein [Pontibacter ummariensis]SNT09971.1 peptide/nickel transport system permease protein [Pontibacter ummariensis]